MDKKERTYLAGVKSAVHLNIKRIKPWKKLQTNRKINEYVLFKSSLMCHFFFIINNLAALLIDEMQIMGSNFVILKNIIKRFSL